MRFVHCAVVAGVVVTVAGCATADPPAPSGPSSAVSGSSGTAAAERTYPGLSPEYRASFRPDHTDLGGRSNAELAQLLPASSTFPPEGRAQPPNVAAEDGSGLGLRGQTAGETKPPQCLYTPFGKNFSRASDGSDWNLYYAASVGYTGPDGSRVTVTVDRQRVGSDVVALTTSWMSTCGTYDRAFPTFANPQVRNQRVTTAFTREQTTSGVQTYRFVGVQPVARRCDHGETVAQWRRRDARAPGKGAICGLHRGSHRKDRLRGSRRDAGDGDRERRSGTPVTCCGMMDQ
ncbi:hypothetical protein TPAU25S_03521 [Tsukamurella paurometabola]